MDIILCDDQHRQAWNAYVDGSARATLYHRFEWRDVNASSFGHRSAYLAALEAGRVVGIFPMVRVKSQLFGNIACSLPFVTSINMAASPSLVPPDINATLRCVSRRSEHGKWFSPLLSSRRTEGSLVDEYGTRRAWGITGRARRGRGVVRRSTGSGRLGTPEGRLRRGYGTRRACCGACAAWRGGGSVAGRTCARALGATAW